MATHVSDYYVSGDTKRKNLVVDDQQRLQLLFTGLCDSFESKEVIFNVRCGNATA